MVVREALTLRLWEFDSLILSQIDSTRLEHLRKHLGEPEGDDVNDIRVCFAYFNY